MEVIRDLRNAVAFNNAKAFVGCIRKPQDVASNGMLLISLLKLHLPGF
jgi:hypothetical protein